MNRREWIGMASVGVIAAAVAGRVAFLAHAPHAPAASFKVHYSDAEWRQRLSPASYHVLREAGTEAPFTSPLLGEHRKGTFVCAGCASAAFSSDTKFDSHTGWPSFWQALDHAVITRTDLSLGTPRTEVLCATCGGHLGHVFEDGPKPTGLRYCMNGLALAFLATTA